MGGLTGEGAAESCDSTQGDSKTHLEVICISNLPDIQHAVPEPADSHSPLSI